jgi:hypothetical protein
MNSAQVAMRPAFLLARDYPRTAIRAGHDGVLGWVHGRAEIEATSALVGGGQHSRPCD